jgi:hypothetical protein
VQINILLRGYIGFITEGLHWVTVSIWSIIMVKAKLINDPDTVLVITVKVHILLRGYIGWFITEGLYWITVSVWIIIIVKAKLINDFDIVILVKVHKLS